MRKSLHWNLPSSVSHQKSKRVKPTVNPPVTTATSGRQKLTTSATVKPRKSAKKTTLLQQGKQPTSAKRPATDKTSYEPAQEIDGSSTHTSEPTVVLPWEQTGGDEMSVINIYARKYEKLQEQFNATAG